MKGFIMSFLVFFSLMAEAECPKLTGRVVLKGDSGYEHDRLVSNYYTSKDKFPIAIVFAQNTTDVQNAIKHARCTNTSIRIRSGGHNHEAFSTGTDVILIDVSEMKALKIDKEKGIAAIEPGINNLELYTRLYDEGLTHVGGTCSEVGLSGLVLTGGMGPLLRRVGLTCDSLVSIDIIDAKGTLLHATKDNEHKDLFWASQGGGGGNFGVVTKMELKVYPVADITWFNIGWNWNDPVEQVLTTWQNFFSKQDRNFFSHLDLWAKPFPEEKLNKKPIKALGYFWGTTEEAKKQLQPFLSIGAPSVVIEKVTWMKAIEDIEESTAVFLTDKPTYKSTGTFVRNTLPKEGVELIINTLKDSKSPLLNVLFFTMGGATAEVAPDATAYYWRPDNFFINLSTQWLNAGDANAYKTEIASLREKLAPFTEGNYVGNPDPNHKNFMVEYYGKNAERLQCIKKKYDPDNFFKFEQSIPPECKN